MNDDNDKIEEKRKRGRPIGSVNNSRRASQFTHYNPKRWQPEFDLMVLASINGLSNEEIGNQFRYTKQQVSNILSTAQAKEIKDRVRKTIDVEFSGTLKERIAKIGAKTIEHIENFVEDSEGRANSSPFYFIDRIIKISAAASTMDGEVSKNNSITVNGNAAFLMTNDQANNIKNALLNSIELDSVQPGDYVIQKDIESPKLDRLKVG